MTLPGCAAAKPITINIGYTGNLVVTAEVRTLHLDWNEAHTALLDHRVDAAIDRKPLPTDQLDITVLYDEPRVLVVPTFHRLAGKESVTLDDFADEPLPRFPDGDPDTDSEYGTRIPRMTCPLPSEVTHDHTVS